MWGLNGAGTFSADISTSDPKATSALFRTLSRDILVLRNGVPEFNGPIIGLQGDHTNKKLQITAASPWWWMSRRTMELSLDFTNTDMAVIFDQILATTNGKFAGDVRLTKPAAYNSTGQSFSISYPASSRKVASEAISELAQVYPGFDWFISLRIDPNTGRCIREYNVYAPFKGAQVDQALTAFNTTALTTTEDGSRVFNRVHEMGSGSDNTQLIISRSDYEPVPYYDYGKSLSGWTYSTPVNNSPGINQTYGNAPPAFQFSDNAFMHRSTPHGVGSTIEFDIFSTKSGGNIGTANSTYFYFGCDASGAGNAFCPWATSGTPAVSLQTVQGYAAPTTSTIQYGNYPVLESGRFFHVTIQIDTATSCRLFVDDQHVYRYNPGSGAYDLPNFVIQLNGDHVGAWDYTPSSSGLTIIDNIGVTAPTTTYVQPAIPYIEKVISRNDIGDLQLLNLYATADLFLGKYPSQTVAVEFRPSAALPFGFARPGDTVLVSIHDGYFQIEDNKRIINVPVSVDDSGGELVKFEFNDPHA